MKKLLIFAAISEGITGLVLFVYPPLLVRLLFDSEIAGAGVLATRFFGFSLLGLAVACWPDSNMGGAFLGMFTYSTLATLYFLYLGASGVAGILLWPAAAVHAGLSVLLANAWQKQRHVHD